MFATYPKLLQCAFDRLRWNAADFRVLRFELTYPPIPTAVLMRAPLPLR